MSQVTLRNHGITIPATQLNDTYTGDALEHAQMLKSAGHEFFEARVDRVDGLVVMGPSGNWHFTTPLCGYGGNGPITTARILELFGFGDFADIMHIISVGGNHAHYTLTR